MNRFPFFALLLASCVLTACSSSNTPADTEKQDDPGNNEPMDPVASELENGQQFVTSGRAAALATMMSSEITSLLNTLNQAVTSGTTGGSSDVDNCLAGFDQAIGKPVTDFSCNSDFELSTTTAAEFSGQVLVTDYCEAALANGLAQNCALQDGTIGLPLEWVADAIGTPSPLLATTITYRHANMTLTVTTPEQIGLAASHCTYDMANNGQTDEATAAVCLERMVEVSGRLFTKGTTMVIPVQARS